MQGDVEHETQAWNAACTKKRMLPEFVSTLDPATARDEILSHTVAQQSDVERESVNRFVARGEIALIGKLCIACVWLQA